MRSFTGPAEKPAAGRIACPTCRGEAALCYKAFSVKKSSPQTFWRVKPQIVMKSDEFRVNRRDYLWRNVMRPLVRS